MRHTFLTMAAAILSTGMTTAAAAPFRVVIDAGHGGSNTGAPTREAGVFEKRVTLAVARALAAELRARGFDVVMTRQRDEFLTLRERVRRANAAAPDCFVSLHANASGSRSQRGLETYVLARDAVDVEARRAADAMRDDDVRSLLADLSLLEAARGSLKLAQAVQSRLLTTLAGAGEPTLDRGVKQAGYDVLAGVASPAVLVELGFLDHPVEGAQLLDGAHQKRLASALAAAVDDFAHAANRVAAR
jgi:N-acetylmuramoyl-L-alanine amidase